MSNSILCSSLQKNGAFHSMSMGAMASSGQCEQPHEQYREQILRAARIKIQFDNDINKLFNFDTGWPQI